MKSQLISFTCKGHPNILSKHKNSFEFTKDTEITKAADCVVGVACTLTKGQLEPLKEKYQVEMQIHTKNHTETITGYTSPEMTFDGFVVRKTTVCDRKTMMMYSDKSAHDFPEDFVKELQDPLTTIQIDIKIIGTYTKLDFFEGLALLK